MEKTWHDYVSLHSTIEGARAAFEKDCEMLLQAMHPDKPVKVVRADPGDEGIDIYIGDIGVEPIQVYQCKFFLGRIGDSQKSQIRESFKTASESLMFKMNEWHLCMPLDDFNVDESIWWDGWKSRQENTTSVKIYLLNGGKIKNSLKKHDLYNIVFRIEESLSIQEIRDNVRALIDLTKPHTAPLLVNSVADNLISTIGTPVFSSLFRLGYRPAYETFYMVRAPDIIFNTSLASPRNIWVHGISGVGKTYLCTRNLYKSNKESFYCYLTAAPNPQDANEILALIYENIYSKYEESLSDFKYHGDNWIKKIVSLLIKCIGNSSLTICVDELSVSSDAVFKNFANSIAAICSDYANASDADGELKFVISTIKNPNSFCDHKSKISEIFTFIEVIAWSEQELTTFFDNIIDKLGIDFPEMHKSVLLEKSKTPRVLKDVLYQYIFHHKSQPFEKILNDVLDKT